MYLHALGPALQWIDALFVQRAFRRFTQALGVLIGTVLAYVAWAEFVVRPMNDSPSGSVTSGLPYPFLNNLELPGRVTFYGVNLGVAVLVLLGVTALCMALNRLFPRPEGR